MNKYFRILAGVAIAALCFLSCKSEPVKTLSGLDPQDFAGEKNGKETALYTLSNAGGVEVCITNFGGRLVSVMVPDKDGKMTDVILGFDNINDYMTIPSDFGASIGRYANRIGGATYQLDGETVVLDKNDKENCLHGGREGWQYQIYEAVQPDPQTLELTMHSPDGEMGFPGNVTAVVTYKLTDDNAIDITFSATSDKATAMGMTNHAYFNLSGNPAAEATDHILYLNADQFTPTDAALIPTGEILPVEGTPMDFRIPKAVAQDIDADYEALAFGRGYDHNWILNTGGDIEKLAFSLYSPASGILLEGYTDQPGIQVYSGNFLDGRVKGKNDIAYPMRASVCLETQMFPDSPNKPQWPSAILRPGDTYTHRCIYRFSVR